MPALQFTKSELRTPFECFDSNYSSTRYQTLATGGDNSTIYDSQYYGHKNPSSHLTKYLMLPIPAYDLQVRFVGTPQRVFYPSRQPTQPVSSLAQGQHKGYTQRRTSPYGLRVPLIPYTYLVRQRMVLVCSRSDRMRKGSPSEKSRGAPKASLFSTGPAAEQRVTHPGCQK